MLTRRVEETRLLRDYALQVQLNEMFQIIDTWIRPRKVKSLVSVRRILSDDEGTRLFFLAF